MLGISPGRFQNFCSLFCIFNDIYDVSEIDHVGGAQSVLRIVLGIPANACHSESDQIANVVTLSAPVVQNGRFVVDQLVLDLRKKHPEYGLEQEIYVSVPGAEISKDHPLVKTVEACHQKVLASPPKHSTVVWDSDASVMTRFGIETLNYGPSSGPRDAEGEKVAIETLLNTTRIYALAAAEICGANI